MGAALYRVLVEEKVGHELGLRIWMVHPDALDVPDAAFVLRFLRLEAKESDAIGTALSLEAALDFSLENVSAFIADADRVQIRRWDEDADYDSVDEAFWDDETKMPAAVLKVKVTHSKWTQHLSVGTRYESNRPAIALFSTLVMSVILRAQDDLEVKGAA